MSNAYDSASRRTASTQYSATPRRSSVNGFRASPSTMPRIVPPQGLLSMAAAFGDPYHPDMAPRRDRSSILFDLFAASQQVRSLLAAAMEGSGLRADDYAVYSALFEFEPLTPPSWDGWSGCRPPRCRTTSAPCGSGGT